MARLVISHRAHTGVQVQQFAQGHIQRPDPPADRGGQRAFDPHQEFLKSLHGLIRQPLAPLVIRLLSGKYFHPMDLAFATVGFFHCGIKYTHGSTPDIRSGPISFNKGDDRVFGYIQHAVGNCDLFAFFRHLDDLVTHRISSSDIDNYGFWNNTKTGQNAGFLPAARTAPLPL